MTISEIELRNEIRIALQAKIDAWVNDQKNALLGVDFSKTEISALPVIYKAAAWLNFGKGAATSLFVGSAVDTTIKAVTSHLSIPIAVAGYVWMPLKKCIRRKINSLMP